MSQFPWAYPSGKPIAVPEILPIYPEICAHRTYQSPPPYIQRAQLGWETLYATLRSDTEYTVRITGNAHTVMPDRTNVQIYALLRYCAIKGSNPYVIDLPTSYNVGACSRGTAQPRYFCLPGTNLDKFDAYGFEYLTSLGFAPDFAFTHSHTADEIVDRLDTTTAQWAAWCDYMVPIHRQNKAGRTFTDAVITPVVQSAQSLDLQLIIESRFGEDIAPYKCSRTKYFGADVIAPIGEIRGEALSSFTQIDLGGRRAEVLNPNPNVPGLEPKVAAEFNEVCYLPSVGAVPDYTDRRMVPADPSELWQVVSFTESSSSAKEIVADDDLLLSDDALLAALPVKLAEVARMENQFYAVPITTTALLSTCAVAPQISARYKVQDYRGGLPVTMNMMVVQVGVPNSGKSPLLTAIANLGPLQQQLNLDNRRADTAYQFQVQQAKEAKVPFDVPPPLTLRTLILTDATNERLGLVLAHNRNDSRGLLVLADEFLGWMMAIGVYTNGRGNGRQTMLTQFSGGGAATGRMKNDSNYSYDHAAISWIGNTTPEALTQFHKADSHSHRDGLWQRMLFAHSGTIDPRDHSRIEPTLTEKLKQLTPNYLHQMALDSVTYQGVAVDLALLKFCEEALQTMQKCLDRAADKQYNTAIKFSNYLHTISGILSLMDGADCIGSKHVLVANTLLQSSIDTFKVVIDVNKETVVDVEEEQDIQAEIGAYLDSREETTRTQIARGIRALRLLSKQERLEMINAVALAKGYTATATRGGGTVFRRSS